MHHFDARVYHGPRYWWHYWSRRKRTATISTIKWYFRCRLLSEERRKYIDYFLPITDDTFIFRHAERLIYFASFPHRIILHILCSRLEFEQLMFVLKGVLLSLHFPSIFWCISLMLSFYSGFLSRFSFTPHYFPEDFSRREACFNSLSSADGHTDHNMKKERSCFISIFQQNVVLYDGWHEESHIISPAHLTVFAITESCALLSSKAMSLSMPIITHLHATILRPRSQFSYI